MNFNIVVSSFCEPVKNIIESKNTKKNKFSDYYIINFIKNRVSRELMTKNYKSYTDIFQFLRFKCILTSFHDEFTVIKNIGKGSFARV